MSTPSIGDWLLYKNNQLIAFDKPTGIPVQPDRTDDKSLLDLGEIYSKSSLHLLHRIDRPASGIVLFAKTKRAMQALTKQFQDRTVEKTYLAVVKNEPPARSGTLTHYLRKNGKTNRSKAYKEELPNTKKSELNYEWVESIDHYHLLKIQIKTGRHHQIRTQLAAINCPIKGDVKYGFRRNNQDRSIHLHAWKLAFNHPVTEERVELSADVPEDVVWQAFQLTKPT